MYNIKTRTMKYSTRHKINGKIIWDDHIIEELKKYNVPVVTTLNWSTETLEGNIARELEKIFLIPEYDLNIKYRTIKVETSNLTQFEHKQLARRIYRDAQKKGFKVSHECVTEVTKESCLNGNKG